MRGDDGEMWEMRVMDNQCRSVKNGRIKGLIFRNFEVIGKQDFTGICLGVDIDKQDILSFSSESSCKRDAS